VCAETKRHKGLVWALIATLILGIGFLGIKSVEYHEKVEKHHIPGDTFSVQSFVNPDSDAEAKAAHDKPLGLTWRARRKSISRCILP